MNFTIERQEQNERKLNVVQIRRLIKKCKLCGCVESWVDYCEQYKTYNPTFIEFQHCLRRSLAILSFLPRDPIAVACNSRARDGLSTLNFSRQFRALRKSINHSRPIGITESRLISIFSSTKEVSS